MYATVQFAFFSLCLLQTEVAESLGLYLKLILRSLHHISDEAIGNDSFGVLTRQYPLRNFSGTEEFNVEQKRRLEIAYAILKET